MMMRKELWIAVFMVFFATNSVIGQDANIMSGYDRPTIANIILNFGDQTEFEKGIIKAYATLPENPKCNLSNIPLKQLTTEVSREQVYSSFEEGKRKDFGDRVRRILSDKAAFHEPKDSFGLSMEKVLADKFNVGGKLMKEWATQDSNMNYVVLGNRSKYNLSAEDLKNDIDHTRLRVFEELLRTNYIFLYDVQETDGKGASKDIDDTGRVQVEDDKAHASIHAFIYKVDISDRIFNKFVAPNFHDEKAIAKYKYPIKYMGHAAVRVSFDPELQYMTMQTIGNMKKDNLFNFQFEQSSGNTSAEVSKPKNPNKPVHEQDIDWENLSQYDRDTFIYNHIARTGFEDVFAVAEMNIEDFKVKAPVLETGPIVAPIGKKEGVVPDQRYRVYQNLLKDDSVVTQSIGLIRASNEIANNASSVIDSSTGEVRVTEFKQIYGKSIEKDMYIVQDNDYGLSLSVGTKIAYLGADVPSLIWHARATYNISRSLNRLFGNNNLYGYYGYFGLGFGSKKIVETDTKSGNFSFDFGVAKRLYLGPKFDIVPETGFTIATFNIDEGESEVVSDAGYFYWNIGARAPIKLAESFAIEPAVMIPLKLSSNEINPASFAHFAIRARFDF